MDFSEEWKSLWPISAVFSAPLLLPAADAATAQRSQSPTVSKRPRTEDDTLNRHKETGPLVFIPNLNKPPSLLFSSPTLSPLLPPPYPNLSIKRFLSTSGLFFSPTTASHIAKEFSSNDDFIAADDIDDPRSHMHAFNSLQLLPCSSVGPSSSVLAFFPTGENFDQVGYLMLRPKESELMADINSASGNAFVANEKLNSRILKLLVIPVADFDDSFSDTASPTPTFPVIGYVMACTIYSVYWFAVKTMRRGDGFKVKSICVDCVGSRMFRSCAIVDSCWNPHLSEECLVLSETGDLYLFDLTSCLKKPSGGSKNHVQGRKLHILSNNDKKVEKASGLFLLVCAFSWHPRIFIIAHSSAVLLVDARFETYVVSCLLKIEMLSDLQNDGFVALSRDNTDGFRFCVASKSMLFLCDVRQPLRPLLRWAHSIENPRYLTIFKLSELRSNVKDVTYEWASETGSCVLLGSFWDCEFNLFTFGPNTNKNPVISEISKFCNSVYAWSVPSQLSLSSNGCFCGRCFVREEAFKESLPDWINWRQKKDIVLGFGILHGENFVNLSEPENNNGGFLLIRLMSSGKLESHSYNAVWEFPKKCGIHYDEWNCDDNLLYDKDNHEYKSVKFLFLDLPYFDAYMKGNLDEIIVKEIAPRGNNVNAATMSGKSEVFKDINLPCSIHEIGLRSIYTSLHSFFSCQQTGFPGILKIVSNSYGNIRYPFPFRLPLSQKITLDELGDSFLPPQFLLNLRSCCLDSDNKERNNTSPDEEIEHECYRVEEMVESRFNEDHVVSLCDEADELKDCCENTTKLEVIFHEPSCNGGVDTCENKDSTKFVYLKRQDLSWNVDAKMNGFDLLDRGCPLELHFDNSNDVYFEDKELKQFQLLKKHDLKFQKGFHLYQEYLSTANLR